MSYPDCKGVNVIMKYIVITNNPLVYNKVEDASYYSNASFYDILIRVRDKVHLGHRLLTHPLSGSVKPGHTPYKSVVISALQGEKTDYGSLALIEYALDIAGRVKTKIWGDRVLLDFQLSDYSLIADIVINT